jgi:hypothetical protein
MLNSKFLLLEYLLVFQFYRLVVGTRPENEQ